MDSKRKREIRNILTGVAFLIPNICGFLFFSILPLAISLFMAFTDWNLEMHNLFQNQEVKFVGFENFIKLFTDPDFFTYLGNTLFLMLGIPFGIAGSLGAAILLNNDFKKGSRRFFWIIVFTIIMTVSCTMLVLVGMASSAIVLLLCGVAGTIIIGGSLGGQTVYRTLFYFPHFTSGVATYILWKKLYNPENGPVNNVLQPVLDTITPAARQLSMPAANTAAAILLILMAMLYAYSFFRRCRKWHTGECGTASLLIGAFLLSIPMFCSGYWSALSWGGALGWSMICLAGALLCVMCFRGRFYRCVADYGMADSIIIDGMLMIGIFILLGMTNVITAMPEAASEPNGLSAPKWLSDYYWAKPSIMIMGFWGAIGSNNMLLYLAGLSGISPELYEAADIDGASPFQRFWNVTWPQLANVTFFILVMSVMNGLRGGFEMARVMTKGGPAGSTTTLAYYIYTEGFGTGRLGYASAVAWTLFAMVFCITVFNWKFGNRYTND